MIDFDPIHSLLALGLFPGALVLDLGCGTGLQARALTCAGYHVVGVDSDVDAVTTARELDDDGAPRPRYLVARGEGLSCRDGIFDAVVCLDVLHWCADESAFRAAWAEAWRVLKPGGVFVARCRMFVEGLEADGASPWFLPTPALLEDQRARVGGEWRVPPVLAGASDLIRFAVVKPR